MVIFAHYYHHRYYYRVCHPFLSRYIEGKDLPAQFNLRLLSSLDDFLEQNPIVTTKH